MQTTATIPRGIKTLLGNNKIHITRVQIKTSPETSEKEIPGKHMVMALTTFCGISVRKKSSGAEEPVFVVYECWGEVAHRASRLGVDAIINVTGHIKPNDWLSESKRHYGPIRVGVEDFDIISVI